jgi:hypothetical protein
VLSREEMSELQKQLARWTTEPKQFADTEAGSGQRILDEDKENLPRAHEELSAIHGADETLSQRDLEDLLWFEADRREMQRMMSIRVTLPLEELSRLHEQKRLLLQERERGPAPSHTR